MAISNFGVLIQRYNGASYDTVAGLLELDPPELVANAAEFTRHDGPGWMERLPTILDGGQPSGTIAYEPGASTHEQILDDLLNKTVTTWRFVHPDTGGTIWEFTAFVSKFKPTGVTDDIYQAEFELSISGVVAQL